MAIKQVAVSDLSGIEMDVADSVRLVVSGHEALDGGSIELDVAPDELDFIRQKVIGLVNITVFAPGSDQPVGLVLPATAFDELFEVGTRDVFGTARTSQTRQRVQAGAVSGRRSGAKANYGSPEHGGQLHRGRLTDAEAAWVRENMDQASKNREAQTGKPIDWSDAKEKRRYGL
jgi:hypothetical protein